MWTYILGPFFALLPNRWRKSLRFSSRVEWNQAAALSGLAECIFAVIALAQWYSHSMSIWVANGVAAALEGKVSVELQVIGAAALTAWALHPLTWVLGYVLLEGAVRACAGFTGSAVGTLPLFLIDRIWLWISRSQTGDVKQDTDREAGLAASWMDAIRERAMIARTPLVSDEVHFRRSQSEEFLEIRACRRKDGWIPPRIVRYDAEYYRLEADSRGPAPRPFVYTLRKLSAGVFGRNVLLYAYFFTRPRMPPFGTPDDLLPAL
jgi:stage V sporulation protein SpoVS